MSWMFAAVCRFRRFPVLPFRGLGSILLWGLFFNCRVGEASNPGPAADTFTIGAFNPSGLRGKAPFVVSHCSHGDWWAISETHLCQQSAKSFRAGLQFAQSSFSSFCPGHPVPANMSKQSGTWKGVAVLSRYPTKAVPMHGDPAIFQSSRAMISASLIHDVWLTGGVVYGEPDGHLYPQHRMHNEALLQAVVSHVGCLANGPRVIAGDWNVLPDSLPVFQQLRRLGFCDLQDLAWTRWGIPPQNTCKNSTRKDFCFISPELQALLVNVQVIQDVWPDHAILQGVFTSLAHSVPRQVWPTPAPFPWPSSWDATPTLWQNAVGTPDDKYVQVWQELEKQASRSVPFAIPPKAFGRARTVDTKPVVAGKIAPVKKGRKGDFQPHYLCASFRHAQWVRQVRRVQSYVQYAASHDRVRSPHAHQVWGSIIRAKGFHPTFVSWWLSCQHRTHGSPSHMPLLPPTHAVAQCIFESLVLATRSFEANLTKASRAYARLRREANPNMIFQDLQSHEPRGVDLLFQPREAVICEIRSDDQSLVFDAPCDWEPDLPFMCQGKPLEVIHSEPDCVWPASLQGLEVGNKVIQLSPVGRETDLFHLFCKTWRDRWERHTHVPEHRWQQIVAFAAAHLPQISMSLPAITADDLFHCIHHKKATTSGGLDGVSLDDLRAIPRSGLQNFCAMFQHAEDTGQWPTQVLAGRVTSLAKTDKPSSPLDFRPITVLGLLYRCWGSLHARKILHLLDPVLPLGLYGSRPKCFAGQVWTHILWTIEDSHMHQVNLCGLIADLQKAFNMLPRLVIFEACAHVGIPLQILIAWAGALSAMPRRFQIRQSLSPAVFSNCGFPEGDALSCVAMMVIDMIYHAWFQHFLPLSQPLSYVDDWQILLCSPEAMTGVATCLDNLVAELDLVLDKQKTFAWAISADGRTQLRDQGFRVVTHCKNLGAHVQISKQHTNRSQMDRIASLGDLWPKLRLSSCPYHLKVRALRSAAWPRGLHAIAATTLSLQTFQSLRAGALRGLREDHAGCHAGVHLGLIEVPTADPHFWSILQTFRLIKDCGSPDVVESTLKTLAYDPGKLPANSITATLLTRISLLGWHVTPSGHLQDELGVFSLFRTSTKELLVRMEYQWLNQVSSQTVHRKAMQGLSQTSPKATRKWLQALSGCDQALYRKLLNGTHITQDSKHYCQSSASPTCPYCNCEDSRFHRFWQCYHFSWARANIPDHLFAELVDLPEAVTCHGWALRPSTDSEWWAYFANLMPPARFPRVDLPPHVHLFTDGSCQCQHDESMRFASYAVLMADPTQLDDFSSCQVVESGPLPGLLQSAVRAEIFAALRAVEFAAANRAAITLWTDCAAVVRKLRRLIQGHSIRPNSMHADLWLQVSDRLHGMPPHHVTVTKVQAHPALHLASSPLEEWAFTYNAQVDRLAVAANFRRSSEFWMLFHRHGLAVKYAHTVSSHVQQVLLSVSQAVVNDVAVADQLMADISESVTVGPPLPVWPGLGPLSIPPQAVRWYGDRMVRLILSWFWGVLTSSHDELRWISHFQVYGDFVASTGHPGPVFINGWKEGTVISSLALQNFGFKKRAHWFAKVLKECLRHMQQPMCYAYGVPASHMIQTHTGLIALPWPRERLQWLDKWMYRCVPCAFKRQCRALDSLPLLSKQQEFDDVVLTSFGM